MKPKRVKQIKKLIANHVEALTDTVADFTAEEAVTFWQEIQDTAGGRIMDLEDSSFEEDTTA